MDRRQIDTYAPSSIRPALAVALLVGAGLVAGCDTEPSSSGRDGGIGVCRAVDGSSWPHGRLVVATEQYGSGGGITVIDLETLQPRVNVALTHDDVTVRWYGGHIWVINRYGADNIMILDGDDYHLVRQLSIRPAADAQCNAQDIVFLSTCRLIVSCYEHPKLLIVDPSAPTGDHIVGTIDMSHLADEDGIPELSRMARIEDELYVAVQRMDRKGNWMPVFPSYIGVVDIDSERPVQPIELETQNPSGPLVRWGDSRKLVTSTAGAWDGRGGGIEVIDTESGVSSLAVRTEDLGGMVSTFTLDATGCGHAVVSLPDTWHTGVKSFCLEGSTVEACLPTLSRTITDIAPSDDGRLFVTDTSNDPPGVWVYDATTCERSSDDCISTGFAPGFTSPLVLIPGPGVSAERGQ